MNKNSKVTLLDWWNFIYPLLVVAAAIIIVAGS